MKVGTSVVSIIAASACLTLHPALMETALATPTGWIDVTKMGAIPGDGADDTTAIQAAIDQASQHGGIVYFPVGIYDISTTLRIAYANVVLRGAVPTGGIWTNGQPCGASLVWRGQWRPEGMVHIRYSAGAGIEHLRFYGNGTASYAIRLTGVRASRFADISIDSVATGGIRLDTHYEGDGEPISWVAGKANKFEQIFIDLMGNHVVDVSGKVSSQPTKASLVGILFLGVKELATDWHGNMFSVGVIKFSAPLNHTALDMKITDSNTFYEFDLQNDAGQPGPGAGIVFDSLMDGFPLNNAFYNCSIGGGIRVQDNSHKVGKNFFFPYPTKDGEPLPPEPVRGVSDEWKSLNVPLR
jgi:hypothetical protein